MKITPLLLGTSLAANAALVAVVVSKVGDGPRPQSPLPALAVSHPSTEATLRAALASGDVAALTAAGAPESLARELALGRRFAALAIQAPAPSSDPRWWRTARPAAAGAEQQAQWRRAVTEALAAAGIDPKGVFGPGDPGLLSFLPAAKRDALRRINQDYDELTAKFGANGVQLASDRERLKLLRAERERDIAALLSPAELAEYAMRTSPSSAVIRARYGDAIETEDEFRRVFTLQQAFDDRFPLETLKARSTPEGMKAFAEAQRQLQQDIRAAVGEPAWTRMQRAADADLRTLDALVGRLNLPSSTTDQIGALRDSLATESQRINADSAAAMPQRRTQIQELAARAKRELTAALGQEGADAYVQRSPWLSMLAGGLAFSTTPPATGPAAAVNAGLQGIYPVMPAGATSASATRQMVFSSESTITSEAPGGVVREAVRVMTFPTGEPGPGTITTPGQTTTIIVTPPANPPAATPGR